MSEKIVLKELYSKEDLYKAVCKVGKEIERDYYGKELFVIGVLKGSIIFMSDLIREINLPLEIGFVTVSSYGSSIESSGNITLTQDINTDLSGKDLLIVEDIIDSGLTLAFLKEHFASKGVGSIKCCTLLDKPSRRIVDLSADYCGYSISDRFVVGYGLDFDNKYRNLPNVCQIYFE